MESTTNKIFENLNSPKEKSKVNELNILLRFSSSGKVYSIKVPNTWTVRKLEKFIENYFKEEVKSSVIILLLGAKKLENPSDYLSDHLKSENNELNQIIVSVKKNQGSSDMEADKKFWFDNKEFEQAENIYLTSYKELIKKDEEKIGKNQNFLFKMPLMHHGLSQRITSLNEKCKLDVMSLADYGNIEYFSLRDYIKIELLFKLFFFFILFGIHMKGYNIPMFITLLVVYYWYYLYIDINAFYDKKIAEIKLTKEEIRDVKNDFSSYENDENINGQDISKMQGTDNKNEEDIIKTSVEINNRVISQKEKEESNLSNENDINYDINYVKENDIIVENEEIVNNRNKVLNNFLNENVNEFSNQNLNSSSRPEKLPEMEGISTLMKKYENKDRKNSRDDNQEGLIQYYASFILEILFTLVMSLFPFWYDEFEALNPVVIQHNNPQINNADANVHSQIQNIRHEEFVTEDNIRQEEENKFVIEKENEMDKLKVIKSYQEPRVPEENDSLRPEIEIASNKQKLPDYPKSHISEKILIKSSNDTRLVNHSEDHNIVNCAVPKYILVDENENKTENEFVFSENVNIDTLSYNEPILESLKKKNEKEHEDMHLN